jgi:hypothetical protein
MLVYVINQNGNSLMPCKPAKARKLLKAGRAVIVNYTPFTIQLTWDCEEHTQPVTIGIDKGAKHTGFCAISRDKILISGIIHHRNDVKDKISARADNRRQRRSRLWYRASRFLNRSTAKRSGRLPPSIKTNVEEVVRVLKKLPIPIYDVIVEDVLVDIAKLNDPDLTGKAYQASNRLHENLRLACLLRDRFTCRYCKKRNGKLEAHHIVPKSEGGKDTISNLVTLCSTHHKALHKGKIKLKLEGVGNLKDVIAQRTMQGKHHLYSLLSEFGEVTKVFGYQTAEYRKALGLVKDHDVDAFCIANYFSRYRLTYHKENCFGISFRPRQTRKCYHDLPQKGKGRVRYKVNEVLEGFRKGDIVMVKDRFIKQINSIYSNGRLAFKRIKEEPPSALPKDCKLLLKQRTIVFKTI